MQSWSLKRAYASEAQPLHAVLAAFPQPHISACAINRDEDGLIHRYISSPQLLVQTPRELLIQSLPHMEAQQQRHLHVW